MTAQPMLISGGKAHPITAAQWALARAHKPIGPVAGLAPPRAAAPARQEPAPPPTSDSRAQARSAMLAEIGRRYGADAKAAAGAGTARPHGVDPKAATIGERRSEGVPADSRAAARASMLREIDRIGGGVR